MEHGYSVTKIRFPFLVALFGALILAFSSLANAETIPATPSTIAKESLSPFKNGSGVGYLTPQAACEAWINKPVLAVPAASFNYYTCQIQEPGWGTYGTNQVYGSVRCQDGAIEAAGMCGVQTCRTGENWTLSGSTCTRPDCVAPQVLDPADGVCKGNPCTAGQTDSDTIFGGWSIGPTETATIGGPQLGDYCDGQCIQKATAVSSCSSAVGSSVDNPKAIDCVMTIVNQGQSCSVSTKPTSGPAPVTPKHAPKCDPSEGVMTSSSGSVLCVPAGTPSANPPVVQKQVSTQNFPDGSAKTTEITTTRDPTTGAENKITTITNTPATGGGAGEAGPVGTSNGVSEKAPTTGTADKPGESASDLCAKNPGLQICKGGISEEKTQLEIKDLLDPKDSANTDSVTAEKTAYQEKAAAHKDFIDAFASKGQNNEGFLSWAWIPEVPASSCVPFSGTIGGKTITLDWCEQLGMVRDIAGYMFYILTAFGLFRIFANSTGATS